MWLTGFKYYVAYAFKTPQTGETGYASLTYSSVEPLDTEEEIRKLVAQINELPDTSDAVPIWWKRLD